MAIIMLVAMVVVVGEGACNWWRELIILILAVAARGIIIAKA